MSGIFYRQSLLAAVALCLATAVNSQTPQTQPAYPSSPQKRVINPQRERTTDEDASRRRCDELAGVERSECERRDSVDDDAPAGVTVSMREKEEKARAEKEAASTTTAADTRSDTAGPGTQPTSSAKDVKRSEQEKAESQSEEPTSESDTESDSLDRPRDQ